MSGLLAIIDGASGELLLVISQEDYSAEREAPGHEVVALPDGVPLDSRWDAATKTYVEDLAPLTARLLSQIDTECGAFRSRFITTGPGQEMTYWEKEQQARAWLADPEPDANNYPMLAAEAMARSITMDAQVAMVIAQADEWRELGAAIEALRMGAKLAVTTAATREAKIAAALVNWESVLS